MQGEGQGTNPPSPLNNESLSSQETFAMKGRVGYLNERVWGEMGISQLKLTYDSFYK